MEKFKLLIFAALSALILSSCSKDDNFSKVQDEGLIPLNISGSISQLHTKATAEGFVDKDAVGLFAVNYESNNTVAGTLKSSGNQADNVRYDFDEPNHKWVPVRTVYYKDVNTNVDLYVYYPFQKSINDVNAYSFEVQKDQSKAATATSLSGYEASDWMWGKAANITPTEASIKVTLNHRLSAVQVTLNKGTGFEEGVFETLSKNVLVVNTTRKCNIDFANGNVVPVGSPQSDGIVMCPQDDGSFRAVVIPQTISANAQLLAITIDGISYSFKQTSDVVYQPGKQLNLTININKKTPTGTYELELADSQITDWTEDRNSHGGEARQYFVVNVTEPGTLGQLINDAGKNPDKIRNLKVTGSVTTSDFDFMRDNMAILEAVNMKECKIVDIYTYNDPENANYHDDIIPMGAFSNKKSLYYFVFPETVRKIENGAFYSSSLSGPLVLPEDLEEIEVRAFWDTKIESISFNSKLKIIQDYAFSSNYLSGSLLLPESLEVIGEKALFGNFSGYLHLPQNLRGIGAYAITGSFDGDLIIPPYIKTIETNSFGHFTGYLDLSNANSFKFGAFENCGFYGELIIPPCGSIIPENCFLGNNFYKITLPDGIKEIKTGAFRGNGALSEPIRIPEGCIIIEAIAFEYCSNIPSVELPSSLCVIGENAFSQCYGITKIVCHAVEPPTVMPGAFDGIGKDNLTLEVPEQSLIRYQTEPGWSDFKRISAHQDFSLSRRQLRVLNTGFSKTYTLRAPSGLKWSIESKPDWLSVTPESGTGKAEVTITVSEMPRTDETFEREVWKGGFFEKVDTHKGRSGEIVFLLDDKDYRFTMSVEQYDHDFGDGDTQTLFSATKGAGVDIVLMGDGYDALDIASGKYLSDMNETMTAFFGVEPYITYKDYFNVYSVYGMSPESGIGTVNTIVEDKFGILSEGRLKLSNPDEVFNYAIKSPQKDLSKTLVILICNTSIYEGVTYMYGDGSAIAICPKSTVPYPFDFRGIVQHEAGGHGFGKLADEYIYHNAFFSNCGCQCCDHGEVFNSRKAKNWYRNVDLTGNMNQVGWSHLIFNPKYSDYVDVFEGGYMHNRGVFRSEATSCMNNNIPYFSAISRQAIVERIMDYAEEEFTLEKFYANDKNTVGSKGPVRVSGSSVKWPETQVHGHNHGPVYMGEKPRVR